MDADTSARSRRKEIIFILLCCLGALATGVALWSSHENPTTVSSKEKSLGEVRPVGPDIRIHGEADPSWNQVARDTNVYRNDRIFTGQGSRAKVTLSNEQKFTVEPNSLVVITDGQDKKVIDFSSGGFLAQIKKGAKLFVKFKGKETEIAAPEKATVRFSTDDAKDEFKLTVLSGEAEVKRSAEAPVEKVQVNSELDLVKPDAKPRVSLIQLSLPSPGEERWAETTRVEFQWTQSERGRAKVEVSTDPNFSSIVASEDRDDSLASFDLKKTGTYFWRVTDLSNSGGQSVISSFTLQQLIAPQVFGLSEFEADVDKDGRDLENVNFQWNDQIASDRYEIELSDDKAFLSIEDKRSSQTTSVGIPHIKLGHHFWRVRSFASGRQALVSNVGEIVLREKPAPRPVAAATDQKREIAAEPSPTPEPTATPVVATPTPFPTPSPTPIPAPTPKPTPLPTPVATPTPQPTPTPTPQPSPKLPEEPKMIAPSAASRPWQFVLPQFWVWGGAGMDYQYYRQTIPSIVGEGTYQNIQGPVLAARAGFQGKTWGLDTTYRDTPGSMTSTPTTTVTNGEYHWRTLEVEGLYRLPPNWNLRFGIQHHSMPFAALNQFTHVLDIKSNTLTMATVGFDKNFPISPFLRTEWMMRYQYALNSGSSDGQPFDVQNKFAFDGSLGGVYSLTEHARMGLFWYGQYHQYGFNYGSGITATSGSQTLFYSSVELRFGFEY